MYKNVQQLVYATCYIKKYVNKILLMIK